MFVQIEKCRMDHIYCSGNLWEGKLMKVERRVNSPLSFICFWSFFVIVISIYNLS